MICVHNVCAFINGVADNALVFLCVVFVYESEVFFVNDVLNFVMVSGSGVIMIVALLSVNFSLMLKSSFFSAMVGEFLRSYCFLFCGVVNQFLDVFGNLVPNGVLF